MPSSFARPELLASVEWLAENLSRPGVRLVDCRFRVDGTSRQLHAAGHIPGAVFLDWVGQLTDPSEAVPYQLVGPERFAAVVGETGIGDGMTAVLYDDATSLYACRVWWSLAVYGFQGVRVLDGGFGAWQATGRPVSITQRGPGPAVFTPRADPRRRLSTADVRGFLGARDVLLLDVRAPTEYRGQEGKARRLGHIPGAVNLPAPLLTGGGDGKFRPAAELERLFAAAGVTRDRRIITYDNVGIGATKVAFALMLLGHDDVAVYDGGWTEWGDRLDLPLER